VVLEDQVVLQVLAEKVEIVVQAAGVAAQAMERKGPAIKVFRAVEEKLVLQGQSRAQMEVLKAPQEHLEEPDILPDTLNHILTKHLRFLDHSSLPWLLWLLYSSCEKHESHESITTIDFDLSGSVTKKFQHGVHHILPSA
jgi:hypothetical protein